MALDSARIESQVQSVLAFIKQLLWDKTWSLVLTEPHLGPGRAGSSPRRHRLAVQAPRPEKHFVRFPSALSGARRGAETHLGILTVIF